MELMNRSDYRLALRKANFQGMLLAMVGQILISDLERVLLINRTQHPFISSDSPVVLYNYATMRDHGLCGFQSPGLMILLPLGPDLCLCLYDPQAYAFKREVNKTLEISREIDVDEINRFQLIAADEHAIYSDQSMVGYVQSLHESIQKHRKKGVVSRIEGNINTEKGLGTLVRFSRMRICYRPNISFIKVDSGYIRQIKQNVKEHKGNIAGLVRSEEIAQYTMERLKKSLERPPGAT